MVTCIHDGELLASVKADIGQVHKKGRMSRMMCLAGLIVFAASRVEASAIASPSVEVAPVKVKPMDPKAPDVVRGRPLVARNCRGCHSVQSKGISVYAAAPPFRWIKDVDGQVLQRVAFDIRLGDHFAMPRVIQTRSESDDIGAFIRAFGNADAKTQRKLSLPACVATSPC